MAAPAILSVQQGEALNSSVTPTIATHAVGDLLVIVGMSGDGLSTTTYSGWTQRVATAAPYQTFVYSRVATSTTDAAPTFLLNSWSRFIWYTFRFAVGSFDAAQPFDVTFATGAGSSDNPIAPTLTPAATKDHTLIRAVTHGGSGTAGVPWTAPGSHTLVGTGSSMDYLGGAVASRDWTSGSATGTATFLFSPGNDWTAISFLVRPPSGATAQSVDLVPVSVTVTPVDLALALGAVTTSLVPVEIAVTLVAVIPAIAGAAQTIDLVPVEISLVTADLVVVAPELVTDIETNELWQWETDKPDIRWRAGIVGPQGFVDVYEMRSEVDYSFAWKATRNNGAIRWSETFFFVDD